MIAGLAQQPGTSTLLLEKHHAIGTETSSRNSEVIHAGLYYGADSLKTSLCKKGREMMYDYCRTRQVNFLNCGKWIVAQDEEQMASLQKLHDFTKDIDVPTHFISREEAVRREPDVRAQAGVLESPSTGIVDSHTFMQRLHGEYEEAGGETALGSGVRHIEAVDGGRAGFRIWTAFDEASNHDDGAATVHSLKDLGKPTITTETLINSAGLFAVPLSNMLLPASEQRTPFYAKGTYYSYASSRPKPSTLVYPAPIPGHGGLGTHLTFDLNGQVRFGPDVEWITNSYDLTPNSDPERLRVAIDDIMTYLPGLDRDKVSTDYSGIRPKLSASGSATSGKGFEDFYIKREASIEGFVNLLGIESPGLTSSLAIAEMVHGLLHR